MKILSIVSIVLCVVMLAGMGVLTRRMGAVADRLEKIESARSDDMKKLSDEISIAYNTLGELRKEVGALTERVDSAAARGPGDAIEELIEEKLAERETQRRERQEEQARQWWARQQERQVNEILEALDADEEAEAQVAKIVGELQEAVAAYFTKMREGGNWDREKVRQDLEKMDADSREAVKKILPEEQYKKFVEIRDAQNARWERGRR